MTETETQEQIKLALVFISGGSSWATGSDENIYIATRAGKLCKRDWKHLFKFAKQQKFVVHLYDITTCSEGWNADYSGKVTCLKTKQECNYLEKLYVVV